MHNDDISNVLILNKKAVANHENALFANELEKFRPHQNRLIQAAHKQSSLMKDLTAAYGDLLQDKRIRAEQSKYEAVSRQRHSVLSKFSRTHSGYLDIMAGLGKARAFYDDMVETVDSLDKNVETFISNRKSEGTQLLAQIEHSGNDAERQQKKLRDMMERVSINSNNGGGGGGSGGGSGSGTPTNSKPPPPIPGHHSPVKTSYQSPPGTPRYTHLSGYQTAHTPPPPPPPQAAAPPPLPPQPQQKYPTPQPQLSYPPQQGGAPMPPPPPGPPQGTNGYPRRDSYSQVPPAPRRDSYQNQYQPGHYSSPPNLYAGQVPVYPGAQPYNPGSYVPPPPPPGPPPPQQQQQQGGNRQSYGVLPQTTYQPPQQGGGYPGYPPQQQHQPPPQQQPQGQAADPWAGLAGWK